MPLALWDRTKDTDRLCSSTSRRDDRTMGGSHDFTISGVWLKKKRCATVMTLGPPRGHLPLIVSLLKPQEVQRRFGSPGC